MRCCKTFSQLEQSFLWKLCCHWLKEFRQHQIAEVTQGPGCGAVGYGEPCFECLQSINSRDHAVKVINQINTHPFRCVIILEKQACLYGDSIQGWFTGSWETGDSRLEMIKCHFRDTNESRQATNRIMFITWKVFSWIKSSAKRDQFVHALSQWETTLHCNIISHWLGTYTIWSLSPHTVINPILLIVP